jgi:epoxyqueuosine reductase QueG
LDRSLTGDRTQAKETVMARMTFADKRIALAKDGTVTLPEADEIVVGQVTLDPESKKWVARVADAAGKISRAKTEYATRQQAFEALLEAHGKASAEA